MIQIGDKNDFSSKVNRELANEILEEWFDDFEKRNPNLKVYNAVIHNDEASPHMHLNFVPVASGYKRGLEKQVAFDKAIKQQDSTLNKTRPFDDWRDNEVQSLEKKLQERGIERKIVGTNQYKDVNDYKEKKDLEKELQKLNKQILEKKNEMKNMSLILPEQLEIKAKKEMETVIEDKIVHFGKPKTFQKETGNIVVDGEDYKMMCKVVRAAATVKKDYDRLQDSDLVRENNDLRKLVIETRDENVSVRKKNRQLNHHLKEAHEEIWLLKDHISDLKLDIKLVYPKCERIRKGAHRRVKSL